MLNTNKNGLTLVEVIIAMAIFSIIALGFLSMFSTSFIWIVDAGNRGEAYSAAQKDVERRILSGDAYETNDLELTFGEETYSIRGGMVESSQIIGGTTTSLETFIPFIPTITLDPVATIEGSIQNTISIIGKYTHFNNASTQVELLDLTGNIITGLAPLNLNVISATNLKFDLPTISNYNQAISLTNNKYVVRVTTTGIPDIGTEVSRARFIIDQPRYVVAGENSVYISADGINWINRNELPGFMLSFNVNSATNNNEDILIAGEGGRGYLSRSTLGWYNTYISLSERITSTTWSSIQRKYYAAGVNGGIYSSIDGTNWIQNATGFVLTEIHSIEEMIISETSTVLVASGNGGILYQINSGTWNLYSQNNTIFMDTASSGNRILAVGYRTEDGVPVNSVISTYTVENGWVSVDLPSNLMINKVIASPILNQFMAINQNGKLINITIDSEGVSHISEQEIVPGSTDNLVDVYTNGSIVIVVSDSGKIYHSGDGGNTFILVSNLNVNITTITGR